jgi:hypothetical protein
LAGLKKLATRYSLETPSQFGITFGGEMIHQTGLGNWNISIWTWDRSTPPTTPFVLSSPDPGAVSNITGNITTHTHFTDNIVRVGLNYQFH